MTAYAEMLQAKGLTVLRILQGQVGDTAEILADLVAQGYRSFYLADPVDDVLSKRISAFCIAASMRPRDRPHTDAAHPSCGDR